MGWYSQRGDGELNGHYPSMCSVKQFLSLVIFHQLTSEKEIHAQLQLTGDPTYALSPRSSATESKASSLAERWNAGTLCCPVSGQDWGIADVGFIDNGIAYLQGISGDCHLGPNQCSRISCSYGSAIFWCNQVRILNRMLFSLEYITNRTGNLGQRRLVSKLWMIEERGRRLGLQ